MAEADRLKINNIKQLPDLKDPRISLPAFARVQDQKTGDAIPYDVNGITYKLQQTVVGYMGDPPRVGNQTAFLALLGYRQGGKSTSAEIAAYPITAYTPGHDHVCIADRTDRANYLHRRVHFTHVRWPEEIRTPTIGGNETRQLSFNLEVGGKMRILSMQQSAVGIGESPDSVHWSEVGFCTYADEQWTMMLPSVVNRDHCRFIAECTPVPESAGGKDFWHDICQTAKRREGRWIYAFFPFWDGKLNVRPMEGPLTNEEIGLLNRYGKYGLTKENLAFRRLIMATDPEIRRNPELFGVFYPFDDVSCWLVSSSGVIPNALLEKQAELADVDWVGPYMEYKPPNDHARYVIGVDPAGFGVRDHASFHVLELWDDEWEQAACYSTNTTSPVEVAHKLFEVGMRYNKAVIAVESNGVGAAILALLEEMQYPNIYYESAYKPGIFTSAQSLDRMLGWLIDSLMDDIRLHDKDTVTQLIKYRHDKRVETTLVNEIIHGRQSKGRRDKHHWDKVSALLIANAAARETGSVARGKRDNPETRSRQLRFKEMTYNQQTVYHSQQRELTQETQKKPKLQYRRRIGRRK